MDAPTTTVPAFKVNRFLPYAAVFSADVRQMLRSWIYRLWALLSVAAVAGYLLYRFGAKNVGGHKVRSALHALKFQLEDLRESLYGQSLGQAWNAFHQRMASDQHHEKKLIERFALADDGFRELCAEVRG